MQMRMKCKTNRIEILQLIFIVLCAVIFLSGCASTRIHTPPVFDLSGNSHSPNQFKFEINPIASSDFTIRKTDIYLNDGTHSEVSQSYFSQNWQIEFLKPFTIGVAAYMPLIYGPLISPMAYCKFSYSFRSASFFHTFIPWGSVGYSGRNLANWYQPPYSIGLSYSLTHSKIRLGGSIGLSYSKQYNFHDPLIPFMTYEDSSVADHRSFVVRTGDISIPLYLGFRGFFVSLAPSYIMNYEARSEDTLDSSIDKQTNRLINTNRLQLHLSVGIDIKAMKRRKIEN